MCQTVAKYMIENKIKGHILIISSQSALEPSWSPYRLSKLGIDDAKKEQYGQIYVEKFTSASLICKAFYGKMKA